MMEATDSQNNHQQPRYKSDLIALNKLFNGIPMLTLTNMLAALGLCLLSYNSVGLNIVLDWSGVFLGLLLVTLFVWTIYNRKYQAKEITTTSRWVSYYVLSNAVVSAMFSVAYCYLIWKLQTALFPFIAMLLLTQCMGLVFLYSANQTATITLGILAVTPVVAAFALSPAVNAVLYALAIGIFSAVAFVIATASNKQQHKLFNRTLACENLINVNSNISKRLEQTTIEDGLTQIYNRRFYELMIEKEIRRAKRANTSLSVAIIQIDCFDEYQATYGQKAADKCIRSVAKILTNATSRGGEFVARFGESSFALLAPNVKKNEAIAFTSKMQSLVAQADIPHKATTDEHHKLVSVSVGIAEFTVGSIVDVKGLLEQASIALKTANTIGTSTIQVFAQNVIAKDYSNQKSADNSNDDSNYTPEPNHQAQLSVVGMSSPVSDLGK